MVKDKNTLGTVASASLSESLAVEMIRCINFTELIRNVNERARANESLMGKVCIEINAESNHEENGSTYTVQIATRAEDKDKEATGATRSERNESDEIGISDETKRLLHELGLLGEDEESREGERVGPRKGETEMRAEEENSSHLASSLKSGSVNKFDSFRAVSAWAEQMENEFKTAQLGIMELEKKAILVTEGQNDEGTAVSLLNDGQVERLEDLSSDITKTVLEL